MASYREINYMLRPAKSIERKMMVETIRKLSVFSNIEDYQYIGFGSLYFSDFSLFHKNLGITKMISIEGASNVKDRFDFNRPYACIEIKYGDSLKILPKLNLNQHSIIWLDYDKKITLDYLLDVKTVCSNVKEGSLFFMTVTASADELPRSEDDMDDEQIKPVKKLHEYRFEKLIERVGKDKIPVGITGKNLSGNSLSKVLWEIIVNEINSTLNNRSGVLPEGEKFVFKQLFNIKYKDGAEMLTVGGVIIKETQIDIFESARFEELNFISTDDNAYKIEAPNLTLREIAYLDSNIHDIIDFSTSDFNKVNQPKVDEIKKCIPEGDVKKYAKVYRYFPTFTEALL